MKYLIGKTISGVIRAAAFPPDYDDPKLEHEENRLWEKEISKAQFDKLNKDNIVMCTSKGHCIELFDVKDYNFISTL